MEKMSETLDHHARINTYVKVLRNNIDFPEVIKSTISEFSDDYPAFGMFLPKNDLIEGHSKVSITVDELWWLVTDNADKPEIIRFLAECMEQ